MSDELKRTPTGHLRRHPTTGHLVYGCTGCCGDTCLCTACGADTPRFIQVTLAGVVTCGSDDTYTLSGGVNATICLAQTGACTWSAWFTPAGFSATRQYFEIGSGSPVGPLTYSYRLFITATFGSVGGSVGWQVDVGLDRRTASVSVPEFFTGFTAATCTDSPVTVNNTYTSCATTGGPGPPPSPLADSNFGYDGTATVEPDACTFDACIDTEPACADCHGTTPTCYTLTLALTGDPDLNFTDPPGLHCYNYTAAKWVQIDTTDLEGTYTLTRGAGTSCVWTGTIPAFAFKYYADDASACASGSFTIVSQTATITLTKASCGYTLRILSADGKVDLWHGSPDYLGYNTGLYGACADFEGLSESDSGHNIDDLLFAIATRCC